MWHTLCKFIIGFIVRFPFKDDSKAVRSSATQMYLQYIGGPKTSHKGRVLKGKWNYISRRIS